jgi:hypothetical protein
VLEQGGLIVVGTASTIAEALRPASISPSGLTDIDRARVVLISSYAESELTELIEASPAVGFVMKSEFSASAISNLLAGERRWS